MSLSDKSLLFNRFNTFCILLPTWCKPTLPSPHVTPAVITTRIKSPHRISPLPPQPPLPPPAPMPLPQPPPPHQTGMFARDFARNSFCSDVTISLYLLFDSYIVLFSLVGPHKQISPFTVLSEAGIPVSQTLIFPKHFPWLNHNSQGVTQCHFDVNNMIYIEEQEWMYTLCTCIEM